MISKQHLNVIIVTTNLQLSTKLENLIHLIDGMVFLDQFNNAEHGLGRIRDGEVDIAILDVELPDINGVKLTEIIRRDFPDTQVIVTSSEKDYDTMLAVMRNGAADFITYDVNLEELSWAFMRAQDMAGSARAGERPTTAVGMKIPEDDGERTESGFGKIIAVYGPKGGTGVTTLAINLAIALRGEESEIALVDTSLQFGDVPMLLNELPSYSIIDLIPRVHVLDPRVVEGVMLFHKSSGLYILAAPPKPEQAEKVVGRDISQILEFMRTMFSYIVVNTSSYITDPCIAALDSGDVVVLNTIQEVSAIRNTRLFLELCDSLGLQKDKIFMVLNRYDEKIKITPEQVSENVNHPVFATIPLDEKTALQAANLGVPFTLQAKKTELARSVISLGDRLCEELSNPEIVHRKRIFSTL
jgi:pilus assembly protein CpaE